MWVAIALLAVALLPRVSSLAMRRLIGLSALGAGSATLILGVALVAGDFSLVYVAETTSRATPWPYRLSALWGGMEGSMLFYSAMTIGVGAVGLRRAGAGRLAYRVLAAVGAGLMVITVMIANPFVALDIPAVDGRGLLAILQHPAMVYHPPILYLGLTLTVVPFALGVEAAWHSALDREWVRRTRPWILGSWAFLTLGMAAGANWAYIELGWGGFWAWDPVENTALMPWLALTAYLHLSRVFDHTRRMRRLTGLAAMTPFTLTILGIYLTRSGVTGSIHSFAESPLIGRILLTSALIVAAGSVVLTLRSPSGAEWEDVGTGRATWLAVSAALVSAVLTFVTLGSAYPAYVQLFKGETTLVGARFFVITLYPLAVVIVMLLGFGLRTRWRGASFSLFTGGLYVLAAGSVGVVTALVNTESGWAPILLIAVGAGAFVLLAMDIAILRPRKRALGPYLAHLGLAMVILGVAGSALGGEFRGTMSPGDEVEVAGSKVMLLDVTTGDSDRFKFVNARFEVEGSRVLEPQIRAYEDQGAPVAEPALWSTPTKDVVVAISLLFPDAETVDVSVFVKPMVWWVWAGAVVMMLGGLVLLVSRGGAVSGQRREATVRQPPAGTTSGTSAP